MRNPFVRFVFSIVFAYVVMAAGFVFVFGSSWAAAFSWPAALWQKNPVMAAMICVVFLILAALCAVPAKKDGGLIPKI